LPFRLLAGLRSSLALHQPGTAAQWSQTYGYDAAHRLTSITNTQSGTYKYYYHSGLNTLTASSHLVQQLNLPNTSFITNFFDTSGRLTNTVLKNSSSTELNKHRYVYNIGNQRTNQVYQNGDYVDYYYDEAGELYAAKTYTSVGTAIGTQTYGFTYDPAWNMTVRTQNLSAATYTVNNLNQLTSDGSISLTYDDNGNRTAYSSGSYVYDAENQLVEKSVPNSSKTTFVYDGKNRLRKRSEYTWSSPIGWNLTSETRYIYDGMLVIQERNASNVPQVSYTRGPDLSGSLQGAGGIGGLLGRSHTYSSGTFSTHSQYHADANGNVTYMLNSSQTSVAAYRYDPFGRTITSSGTLAAANVYRFSSKEFHSGTGFYYYGYRFYDPNFQRWLNRDPFGDYGSQLMFPEKNPTSDPEKENFYGYLSNRPVNLVDPWRLHEFKGCSQERVDKIKDSLRNDCDKAKKCAGKCKNSPGASSAISGLCDGKMVFTFHCASSETILPDKTKCGDTCGAAPVGGVDIYICPNGWDEKKAGGCGKLSCTIFHEQLHGGGGFPKEHIKDHATFDRCMGCGVGYKVQ
jgi:RHS repeat-associated protein